MSHPSFTERPLLTCEELAGEAVFVAVQRAANAMSMDFEELFKIHGLTSAQYNALRILREAGERGLMCQELGGALITRDPDVTRLADRLEDRNLVTKERGREDRRVVRVRLTGEGLRLLAELDGAVNELHRRHAAALSVDEQRCLTRALGALSGGKVELPGNQSGRT